MWSFIQHPVHAVLYLPSARYHRADPGSVSSHRLQTGSQTEKLGNGRAQSCGHACFQGRLGRPVAWGGRRNSLFNPPVVRPHIAVVSGSAFSSLLGSPVTPLPQAPGAVTVPPRTQMRGSAKQDLCPQMRRESSIPADSSAHNISTGPWAGRESSFSAARNKEIQGKMSCLDLHLRLGRKTTMRKFSRDQGSWAGVTLAVP